MNTKPRKPRKICAVPGCGKSLWDGSISGCCPTHQHHTTYCNCERCRKKRGFEAIAAEVKRPEHPDRVKVTVAYSDGSQHAEVTLPRAPWQRAAG